MKRNAITLLLISLALILSLCSCELAYDAPEVGKMNILVYGNDYSTHTNKKVDYVNVDPNYYYDMDGNLINTADPLGSTINDAVEVGNALVSLAVKAEIDYQITYLLGAKTSYNSDAVLPGNVVNDVSVSSLTGALESLAGSASTNDITVIYFSGHGAGNKTKVSYGTDLTTETYMLLDRDSDDYHVIYPINDFLDLVTAIPGTKVLIGDFCFSGAFVQSGNVSLTSNEYFDMSLTELYSRKGQISESSDLFCLSASRYYELSWEAAYIGHGYFTSALLEALGWDEDSKSLITAEAEKNDRITLFNVANYVIENDKNTKQTPMLSGGSNDVILFSF